MSRQSTLTNYFQSKSSPSPLTMSSKKRSLSLMRTPSKSPSTGGKPPKTPMISTTTPKMSPTIPSKELLEEKKEEEIVTLSSDSEHEATPTKRRMAGISVRSIESLQDRTPVCTAQRQSPVELGASAGASNSSVEIMEYNVSPGAIFGPSPRTPSSQGSSTNGFYSPTKKRVVKKKSPVKRNLASQFNENFSLNSLFENRAFAQIVEDRDDKTGFLLSTIDKYLKSESLKPLLEEDSQVLLEKCMQVVKPGMKLMCRLYWRKPGWYRMEELGQIATEKKNDGDKDGGGMSSSDLLNMVSCLKGFGLITQAGTDGEPNLQFDDYVKLLKRPDILQIAKELKLKIQSKQDAVEALRAFSKCAPITNFFSKNKVSNNSNRVLEILKSKTGHCYKMSDLARTTFYNLYVLMYLGIDYTIIRERKLEFMLINEKINRETFPVDKQMVVDDASVVFQDRKEFYRYLQAHVVYEKYEEETDLDKKCELIKQAHNLFKGTEEEHMSRYKSLPTWLRRFTPPNVYIKILESGVQELKKQKKEEYYKLAVEMLDTLIGQIGFRQHKKPRWYAEKALILHKHLDSSEQAAKILLAGFRSEDITEEMKDEMRPRALKIANQQNILLKESLREELRSYADKESILERTLSGDHIYKQPMELKSKTGHCYKMSDLARTTFYNLYVLMYLGIDYTIIRERKLEFMLINEKINRETFPVDKQMVVDDASVVFQDRKEFYRYLQAHVVYEKYEEETDLDKKCELIKQAHNLFKGTEEEHMSRYKSLPTWLRRFTPPNVYIKILESGVQELKKQKKEEYYKLAVEMLDTLIGQIGFRQHKKPRWYAEKALILHKHLDSSEQAAKILLAGFRSEDITEEMKDEMRPRALKIANQQNILLKESLREELRSYADKESILERTLSGDHIYKQPMDNYNQRGKLKFEVHNREGRSMLTCEEYCIAHYINNRQFTNGEHWEGRIVSTIFFLLFWDIIYSKPRGVTGIFMSHFQRHPLDMFSESFYLNRKTLIDERLMFIQECTENMMLVLMQTNWDGRPESELSEIQRSIGWESVREVTSCLGARGVAAVCHRLAKNYGYACSGFPDLTLWNIHTKKIKFVEVKTDADKPSIKQLQWLQYLLEHGVDAGFCYVGVNTTRSRARPSNNL